MSLGFLADFLVRGATELLSAVLMASQTEKMFEGKNMQIGHST